MLLQEELDILKNLVDRELERYIPKNVYPEVIYDAMRYSLFAGGKRLRPILMLLSNRLIGDNQEQVMPLACAMEMIHTYSLIHDDLPAMDNDDYRRGVLTNHKVFGEAIAILAGDALLTHAFIIMIEHAISSSYKERLLRAIYEIALASGTKGMIGGQVIDIYDNKDINQEKLYLMHKCKTGALITAAVRAGAIVGGASDYELGLLTRFSEGLGIAYQIRDDILDEIGDEKKLGKKVGRDSKNKKNTFVTLYGIKDSQRLLEEYSLKAISYLEPFGERAKTLIDLTKSLMLREK